MIIHKSKLNQKYIHNRKSDWPKRRRIPLELEKVAIRKFLSSNFVFRICNPSSICLPDTKSIIARVIRVYYMFRN